MNLGPLEDEERDKLYETLTQKYNKASSDRDVQDAREAQGSTNMVAGLGQAVANYGANRARAAGGKAQASSAIADFARKQAASDVSTAEGDREKRMADVMTRDKLGREDVRRDPKSEESRQAQMLAKKLMPSGEFENTSAADLERSLPILKHMYEMEEKGRLAKQTADERNADRAETRADRNYYRDRDRQDRLDAKEAKATTAREQLSVGEYGYAHTPDDAKKLKDALVAKESFDRKLQEMIDLRTSKGAEMFDREAVGRGQQLSKDLLLAYKDMAKLGVLSKADEAILNKIIPADPLEWNASSMVGQDPTMHRLKKFQEDTKADFESTLNARLKERGPGGGGKFPRQVRNQAGQTATVSNAQELEEARAEGFDG